MCMLIAMYVSVDCHIWAFCMPEQLPHMGHSCACSLLRMRLLIAISVPVDCHMWACCGPVQLPHMGHVCACRMSCIGLLIAIYVPVDCHMWASCLPHMRLLSVTCGPHVGQTTATCGQRCKTHVAHMCAELFQLPHVGLVWPTCGMFAGTLLPMELQLCCSSTISMKWAYTCRWCVVNCCCFASAAAISSSVLWFISLPYYLDMCCMVPRSAVGKPYASSCRPPVSITLSSMTHRQRL